MSFEQMLKNMNQLLLDLKDNFLLFFPKIVFAVFIIIAGYLIAKLVQIFVKRFFERTKSLITNPKIASYISNQNLEQSSFLISKTMFWIIFIFFITVASETIGLPLITAWLNSIIEYLPNIFAAIMIVVLGVIGGKILAGLATTAMAKAGIFYSSFLRKIILLIILS